MIVVQITPAGVGDIAVHAETDRDEDIDLALWPLVRDELTRLDLHLRREAPAILERLRPYGGQPK